MNNNHNGLNEENEHPIHFHATDEMIPENQEMSQHDAHQINWQNSQQRQVVDLNGIHREDRPHPSFNMFSFPMAATMNIFHQQTQIPPSSSNLFPQRTMSDYFLLHLGHYNQQSQTNHQQQQIQIPLMPNLINISQGNPHLQDLSMNQSGNPLNIAGDISFQSSIFQNEPNINRQNMLNLLDQHFHQQNLVQFPQTARGQQVRQPQLPPQQHQKYYQLLDKPKSDILFNPQQDKYMKITLIRNQNQIGGINGTTEFIITEHGMIGSDKNTTCNDIVIGRCIQQENQLGQKIQPNDIVLPQNDRSISRLHCKIITEFAFQNKNNPLSPEFVEFLRLCVFHWRNPSYWKYLPAHIIKLIWEFSQPVKQFLLQDIGSIFGTYTRLQNANPQQIERGQIYFIGSDNTFSILECQTENDMIDYQFTNCRSTHVLIFSPYRQNLISTLISQKFMKSQIHGLSEEELTDYEALQQQLQNNQQQCNDTFLIEPSQYGRPFVRIEINIQNQTQQQESRTEHIFFGPPLEQQEGMQIEYPPMIFRIGRGGDDNHIRIPHNTISRKQCRFWYCSGRKKWLICDGDINRESSNGTWLSLQNHFDKQEDARQESTPVPVYHGTEIKISDCILKVEIFNSQIQKKQQKPKTKLVEKLMEQIE